MLQIKKNPKVRVEKFSKIFFEIGLALVLFIVYQLLELKSYEGAILDSLGEVSMVNEDKEDIPIINREDFTVPKVTPPPVTEKFKVVQDELDVEETIIEDTETDETESVKATNFLKTIAIKEAVEEEEIVEDVPFLVIEDVPVYPGCTGNREELKSCFTEEIKKFFLKRFDSELAKELGLSPGKKRIVVLFRIDKEGIVRDVRARAPHPKIQSEVIRIIDDLPQMTPGRQRGIPVRVQYTLPITFHVKQ